MDFKTLVGFLLTGSGIVISLFSLVNLVRSIDVTSAVLLVLGCILLVLGTFLRYLSEFETAKGDIDEEKRKLISEEEEVNRIKKEGFKGMSRWKIRDIEYKVKKLESDKVRKEGSEQK